MLLKVQHSGMSGKDLKYRSVTAQGEALGIRVPLRVAKIHLKYTNSPERGMITKEKVQPFPKNTPNSILHTGPAGHG